MKRTFFTFLMLLFVTTAAYSQAQIGLRAGLNVADVAGGEDAPSGVDELWRPGLVIGLATSFNFGEMLAVAPEINFSQRGARLETSDGDLIAEERYNYLEVPVLVRVAFGDVLKGYVNAGPTLGYWLGGNYDYALVGQDGDFDFDDMDDAKRFEIGGAIGGGIKLDTGVGSFLIDLRYTRGFTNMYDDEDADGKNQLISTSLIFLVPSIR